MTNPRSQTNWQIPRELPDLRRVGTVAIDTEENDEGLRADRGSGWPWRGGHVAGISVAWRADGEMHAIYIPLRHPDTDNFDPDRVYRWLKDLVASGVRIVTQNGLYDWGWLRTDGGILMPPADRLEEIGALATLIDENQFSYSLDALCARYGLPGKDTALLEQAIEAAGLAPKRKKKINVQEHIWQLPARFVGPYAEADAVATLALFEKLNPILDQEGTRDAYRLEVDLLPMVLEMRRRGIRIDQDAAEQARDLLLAKRDATLAEISAQLGTPISMAELGSKKWKVRTFDAQGIAYPRTEKGNPSFTAGPTGWMDKHAHWLPQLIVKADKSHGAATKFLETYILGHMENGRVHAEIHPHRSDDGGTRSFRFSYSNPPLQQMAARDKELAPLIRGVFEPEEGERWASTDASQQEYRFIVHHAAAQGLSKAEEAAERYRTDPDTDFHQLVSEWTGIERSSAKNTNFAKAFGAGVRMFAEMIGKPEAEAHAIYDRYDRELPFVKQLSKRCQSTASKQGYLELYDGARRHWDTWEAPDIAWTKSIGPCSHEEAERRVRDPNHPWYRRSIRRAETHKAMNALIQGDAARHTKLWMLACYREGIVPLLQMHDELDCSVSSREQGEMIARLGCEAVKLEVPMRVGLKFGRNWGDAKHTWEELHGTAPATTKVVPVQPQGGDLGGSNTKGTPEIRTSELPSESETEHNLDCAETDVGPIEAHICAQCQLDPPDGREQQRQLSAGESLWLHAHCEDAFIRRRMAEEGIASSPAASAEKPGPSPSAPPPRRINGGNLPPPPPPLEIALTRFTKDGGPLTKQISLAADGTLIQDKSACVMYRGAAERVTVGGTDGLGALIETLTESQALALGGLRADLPDKVAITTKKMLLNGTVRPDLIARIAANIVYRGPAFALIDFDTKGMPATVASEMQRHGGFWPALLTVLPVLEGVARLTRSSTSAGLSRSDTGAVIAGSDGVHVYPVVKDGADIERFLRALHDRCWLKGLGWFVVSRSGALLNRSLVDRMVGQASRLVFEGGPVLKPPLQQDKASRRPISIAGVVLDTLAACPPLTIVEQSRLDELKARERERLAPEKAKAQAAFVERQAKKLVARKGISEAAARQVVLRQCEGILRPDIELKFDDPDLAGCTVGDVLADPERFEGETLADPLEGEEYGPCKARIMRRADGTPWIHSFAHGRTIYTLKHDVGSVRKEMEAAAKDEVVATFALLAAGADLDAIEMEELRQLAKNLSGVGLRVINSALKAAQQKQAAQNLKAMRTLRVGRRQDPRPRIRAPLNDEPWLPQMGVLNEVIGAVVADTPPARDIDDDATQMHKLPISGTHAFTDANQEGGEE